MHLSPSIVLCVFAIGGLGFSVAACGTVSGTSSRESSPAMAGSVTSIVVRNIGGSVCPEAPVTFGQPFRRGDLPDGETIVGYLDDRPLLTQVNIKARNPDGSARHAVITMMLPCQYLHGRSRVFLVKTRQAHVVPNAAVSIRDLLDTRFSASLALNIKGKRWSLAARPLLEEVLKRGGCARAGVLCRRWLKGGLVSEWVVGGPIRDARGRANPHLAAYFAVRAYGPTPIRRVRVDVSVENDWAYQPDPHNYHYDAVIDIGRKPAYRIDKLTHYQHARWHKIFWWGRRDSLYAALNSDYLQTSKAVPRYQDVRPSERLLARVPQACTPMKHCNVTRTMGNTGAQSDIGPLPRWSSVYVVDTDYRAYRWMLANADALGSYGIHLRDKATGEPVSVENHPCITTVGLAEVRRCPAAPHRNDILPRCRKDCKSPLIPDESHHPAPAYVAYLVTGDWYYMEELEFWADWVEFWQNPAYRDYQAGLIHRTQVRGQAWALRTLGDAAYILPDDSSLKRWLNSVVENNIRWYNHHYTDNPDANRLHIVTGFNAFPYTNHGQPRTGTATWQQSFFDWAVGNLADQGFAGARRLRNWFAEFPIGLMTAPGYCWELASAYELRVRDTRSSPIYESLGEVYRRTFPRLDGVSCQPHVINAALKERAKAIGYSFNYPPGSMVGYPRSPTGFPANFQIGLAAAADSGLPGARKAWNIFAHRASQPNYRDGPQFAVIPRTYTAETAK